MGFLTIIIGLILFAFLALVTLLMNPPEAWVEKLTSRKKKDPRS